jgi:hypothetical protein
MDSSVSRRSLLKRAGVASGALAGIAAGLMPERALARSVADPGLAALAQRPLIIRHRVGADRERRLRAIERSARGAEARSFLAQRGIVPTLVDEDTVDLQFDDAQVQASLSGQLLSDKRSDTFARVIYVDGADRSLTGVTIWKGSAPQFRQVYDWDGSRFAHVADLTGSADGTVTIVGSDGKPMIVPPHPMRQALGAKAGLAAPQSGVYCTSVCSWACTLVFTYVCTSVLIETCVISLVCGPLAVLCAGACIITVGLTCAWNANNYCSWSCSSYCYYTEQWF